ncbi:MAG: cell division protein ZapA [Alphaproteobacteria bacterium]|nr:cell division protein ZapA [Alphaproteobacteria bacterium]
MIILPILLMGCFNTMSQITITINSREYAIACEDGQEAHILQLSRLLDEKAKLLGAGVNQISESMLLAMVGLLLADEICELKKGIIPADTSLIDNKNLQRIDEELASTVKSLNNKLKTLANEINLL